MVREDASVLDNTDDCKDKNLCNVDCQAYLKRHGYGSGSNSGVSVLDRNDKNKEDWYKENCPVNWYYDITPILKNHDGNYDPLAISSYYYACIVRSYQKCGTPLTRSPIFQNAYSEFQPVKVNHVENVDPVPTYARVSLPNRNIVNWIQNLQNSLINERNMNHKNGFIDRYKYKQQELTNFIQERNNFAKITGEIARNTQQASWLQVALLDQYKQLNDVLKSKNLPNDDLSVTDIDKNYNGCQINKGRIEPNLLKRKTKEKDTILVLKYL